MAPILLALALLAQDGVAPATPADGPVSTQTPRKQDVAPLPIQGGKVTPPTDDYGYVAWCLGAVGGYVELYDRAMPEVIRIERAWPTPGTEENIAVVYPQQKKDAIASLVLYKRAIDAAEKASPTPISKDGAAAVKKGRAVWTGATSVPKAQLAQFWMSWAPPAKCDDTAKTLEAKSTLFGQALTANTTATPAAAPLMTPPPAAEPAAEQALAETAPTETPAEVAEVEAAVEAPTPAADAPLAEAAAPAEEAPVAMVDTEETPASEGTTVSEGGSAIDALLPSEAPLEAAAAPDPEPAPVAVEEEAAPAPKAAAPKPAAAPAKPKPASPKKKPGLRDTLKGLRGPQ